MVAVFLLAGWRVGAAPSSALADLGSSHSASLSMHKDTSNEDVPMTPVPACEHVDPETGDVCGRPVLMPTMRPADNTFGPYLCPEHLKAFNAPADASKRPATPREEDA